MNISIIIPVYNVVPYIEACLRSVMRQTYSDDMECLLIDDCGTDESIAIAERMIAEYKGPIRFEVIRHKRNRGLSAARNTGIDVAKGEYIYFLDSDDEITDNCIELLMKKMEEDYSVELVQGRTETLPIKNFENLSSKSLQTRASTKEKVRKSFYQSGTFGVYAWNKLIKRSFILENNLRFMEGVIFEDTPWTFHLLKHLTNVSFINEVTYHYNRRPQSIATGTSNKVKACNFRNIYHHILTNLTPGHEREEFNYYVKKFSYFYARFSCVVPEYKDEFLHWKSKAKDYGNLATRMRLITAKALGSLKYGWLVLSLFHRVEHPAVVPVDIQRIWYKVVS